jgi:hypothetical protein
MNVTHCKCVLDLMFKLQELPNTIGRTTTHERTHTQVELTDGSAAISTAILEAPEDYHVGRNI